MLSETCRNCHRSFRIEDVKVDEHWNSWSLKPAYCHCPHCNAILKKVYPDFVDLAKHFKRQYIGGFLSVIALCIFGIASNTLEYVGPIMIFAYGGWLTKTAQLKDHRIIGWILIVLGLITLVAFSNVA